MWGHFWPREMDGSCLSFPWAYRCLKEMTGPFFPQALVVRFIVIFGAHSLSMGKGIEKSYTSKLFFWVTERFGSGHSASPEGRHTERSGQSIPATTSRNPA